MPAMLKGTAKIKVPDDAKPGDEIEVTTQFTADQEDFNRGLRERLDQQKRQHEKETEAIRTELTELKEKADGAKPDAKQAERITKLEGELAQSRLTQKVDRQLKQQGLLDLPEAYQAQIKLKPDATDDEIKEAVAAAGEAFKALKTSLGVKEKPEGEEETEPAKNLGTRGSGQGNDKKGKLEGLTDKVRRLKPNLLPMLSGLSDEQQLAVMQSWEAQGVLTPKK